MRGVTLLLRRLGAMLGTALCLSLLVFWLTHLPPNLEKLAKSQGSARMSDAEVASWLERSGFDRPLPVLYGEWLGVLPRADCGHCGVMQGEWGQSTVFRQPVSAVILRSLAATGWLMLWVMAVMVPTALALGALAGMREGSRTDRTISVATILTAATPEYVSGVVLVALFASATAGLSPLLHEAGWIERRTLFQGTASGAMTRITFWNFALPVATIALYGTGYIARITRASMAEVMAQPYIRTARLKGAGLARIVLVHALRNALVAPVTVILLQLPWLLNGVVIVETLFAYKGFGWTLVQAAGNNDIALLLGCSVVAVTLVLATQALSDLAYRALNPRLRVG
ncbi:ABC transporter permease [Cereibacter azotoformans]|nr:ABC transporter permease [Cereibacter azotoformans]AXQ94040.1 ABC transporter permease [Cereibacter sphaeroides]MBO4168158.1 ABC transporter permease [Cereibacter azotoformans]UIJ29573.1 ABC transporter permease [Cereibacter azotoformans]